MEIKKLGNIYGYTGGSYAGNIYSVNGLSPTIKTMQGGNKQPMIIIGGTQKHQAIKKDGICTCLTSSMGTGGGYIPMVSEKNPKVLGGLGEKKSNGGTQYFQQDRVYSSDGVAMSHPASIPKGSYKYLIKKKNKYRIRKLTPKECWRLMRI